MELLTLLLGITSFIAIIWIAFSLSKLVVAFQAFHADYQRVHKLDPIDLEAKRV